MALFMIATIKNGKQIVGLRLLDIESNETKDVRFEQVRQLVAAGKVKVENLEVKNGVLVGVNGAIERYGTVGTGKQTITIIEAIRYEDKTIGFKVSDCNGSIKKLRLEQILSTGLDIANGKIVERDGAKYISSINGEYQAMNVEKSSIRNSTEYYLMNKDTKLAKFKIDSRTMAVYDESIYEKMPIWIKSISEWLLDRVKYEKTVSEIGRDRVIELVDKTFLTSFNDTLWIKKCESGEQWSNVSPYRYNTPERNLNYSIANELSIKNRKAHTSERSISGSFPKLWENRDGKVKFIKSGSIKNNGYSTGNEQINEVLVCQLEKYIGIDSECVEYKMGVHSMEIKDRVFNVDVTYCDNMCNENVGLVSAYSLGECNYEEVLEVARKLGDGSLKRLLDCFILDCLTVNTDRHLGNISLEYNNDTFELERVSKIYDFNLALLPDYVECSGNNMAITELADSCTPHEYTSFEQLIKFVYKNYGNKQNVIEMLEKAKTFRFSTIDNRMSERISKLSDVVNRQAMKMLEALGVNKDEKKTKEAEIADLVTKLNKARKVYEQGTDEIMSNKEYDELYDRLLELEKETGIILKDSPTQNVGYEVVSKLEKERHATPMLSLDKTKSVEALADFLGDKEGILSWKMDGLTVVLTYRDGKLVKAVTRGNGEIGEVVTNNANQFINVPKTIRFKGELVLRGEAVISYSDFDKINSMLGSEEEKYKNPRNLCSGSVRQLDSGITAQRKVRWIAFDAVNMPDKYNKESQYNMLESLGFEVVENIKVNKNNIAMAVSVMSGQISSLGIPTDGLVLTYNDVEYGKSLGNTAKFPRHSIAFKWKDEAVETVLTGIEWSASRTGLINPVALFEPVDIEGSTVARASIHNVSIMKELELGIGDTITVYKANMIIPQLSENLTRTNTCEVPAYCPVCGSPTVINTDPNSGVETLYCENEYCSAKGINAYSHFVARDAMNIEGLSEATLTRFVNMEFINEFADIYKLDRFASIIAYEMEGFGEKSYNKLITAIDKSRNVKLANLIYALGIPNVGLQTAKLFAKASGYNIWTLASMGVNQFLAIEGVGDTIAYSMFTWLHNESNARKLVNLLKEVSIVSESASTDESLSGKTFCCTGAVYQFKSRNELKDLIESKGGKLTGSVTSKTDYLITNDTTSGSSKNKAAAQLGIPVITEEQFIQMFC